jgi:hypothetical protein
MECSNQDICKHCQSLDGKAGLETEPETFAVKAKGKKSQRKSEDKDLLERFKVAKNYIRNHPDNFDDNQILALKAMAGKSYDALSDEQRQQLIDIVDEVKSEHLCAK